MNSQGQLVDLHAQEENIWAILISIQYMLTPHMEILHKELAFVETLMQKDPHLSILEGLVYLGANLAIQIK